MDDYDVKSKTKSEKVLGIYANEEIGTSISEIFKNDLQSLIRSNRPQVRVLFGDNGTGKTTHLDYFKQLLNIYYQGLHFFFEIDLRHIAEKTEEGLWLAIFNQIYDALIQREDIIQILKDYDIRQLRNIFKSSEISKKIKNFGQDSSEDYFLGKKFRNISNIQSFFNGIIDILMEKKILTVIAIDEVQQIEKWGDPVFQAFLESFVSSTYDRYMRITSDSRLFFILSFLLKSPVTRNDKYSFLEKYSPGFVSRMRGRGIIFCDFTEEEHNDSIILIADITNLTPEERSEFERETKSKLTYWITRNNPREFGKYIKKIYSKLGLLKITSSEKREIYEKEGRDYIKPILIDKGFTSISEHPKVIEGYEFDIYGETKHRSLIKKCVFGEIKTTQRKYLKGEVEVFSRWLSDIKKTSLYNHDDNYYFFVSPFEPTKGTQEIVNQYNIDWFLFNPPELIFEEDNTEEKKEKRKRIPEKKKEFKFSINSKLKSISTQISGLGAARIKKLEENGIITIENLREANLSVLAGEIKGISKNMLYNWKKECEKLINP